MKKKTDRPKKIVHGQKKLTHECLQNWPKRPRSQTQDSKRQVPGTNRFLLLRENTRDTQHTSSVGGKVPNFFHSRLEREEKDHGAARHPGIPETGREKEYLGRKKTEFRFRETMTNQLFITRSVPAPAPHSRWSNSRRNTSSTFVPNLHTSQNNKQNLKSRTIPQKTKPYFVQYHARAPSLAQAASIPSSKAPFSRRGRPAITILFITTIPPPPPLSTPRRHDADDAVTLHDGHPAAAVAATAAARLGLLELDERQVALLFHPFRGGKLLRHSHAGAWHESRALAGEINSHGREGAAKKDKKK